MNFNSPSFVFILIMCRQDVNQPCFNTALGADLSDYRAAKWPSVRDVHRLQTYRDSPSTFLESSVSFKNTFRAPLGKEKAPLVFPSKWNKSVSLAVFPFLSVPLSHCFSATTSPTVEAFLITFIISLIGNQQINIRWEGTLLLLAGWHLPIKRTEPQCCN